MCVSIQDNLLSCKREIVFALKRLKSRANCGIMSAGAIVAQLVEQLIRNEQVTGSIPANGSIDESVRTFRTLIYKINQKWLIFLLYK